ncbi:MAG: hypothetical protein LBU91_05655 [Bacteroidales bacterium]|jgi:opacity protein-like surface antigen|nr:hypothetical protein [Bacteroidales bacterium]
MKKIIITLTFSLFAILSYAQFFVGGQLGFNSTINTAKPNVGIEQKTRNTAFAIVPSAGYQFKNKFALGLRPNLMLQNETAVNYFGSNDDYKTKSMIFAFEAFGQYTFVKFGKWSIYADAGVGLGKGKSKMTYGSSSEDLLETTIWGINIKPVLAYDLSEKIKLLANLNFLGLVFTSTKIEDQQTTSKTTENIFDFSVNTDNLFTIGAIQIGAIYKF